MGQKCMKLCKCISWNFVNIFLSVLFHMKDLNVTTMFAYTAENVDFGKWNVKSSKISVSAHRIQQQESSRKVEADNQMLLTLKSSRN